LFIAVVCFALLPAQRGDAEMSQKLWRVVRSCVELGAANPCIQIHDQGAGGNCNVVKEIIYPLGGEIDVRAVKVGGCRQRV
jgi:phosphoribosylformylglycinamidine synthase